MAIEENKRLVLCSPVLSCPSQFAIQKLSKKDLCSVLLNCKNSRKVSFFPPQILHTSFYSLSKISDQKAVSEASIDKKEIRPLL